MASRLPDRNEQNLQRFVNPTPFTSRALPNARRENLGTTTATHQSSFDT
ncbi:hypothetical protein ACFU93_38055 [Streptomyces sp. NPDC057611]